MVYKLILKEAEEGGFIGIVPEIPGAFTQGETEEEVRQNIRDAIQILQETRMELAINDLGETDYKLELIEV